MMQWLPRGFSISDDKRIKKVISSSDNWQIYSTNQDTYVLAVTTALYESWLRDYSLPDGIFQEIEIQEKYRMFCSKGDYLISSLENGPYPDSFGQVEAFSIAFNTTLKLFPEIDLKDAVYIEEYSLILPGNQTEETSPKDYVYGKWLTGGINISANSFERISRIMLGDLKAALSERGIKFEYTDAVCTYVAERSFSRKFGARNMRRFIQTNIEDRLANAIIFENKAPIEAAAMDVKDGELTLQYI
jgi:hypothetical protein